MRVGSLCSGYEGLTLALEEVFGSVELAFVADNDPGASKILACRYPDVPNLGDISAVQWKDIPPVDILTMGFPCTDVSGAGRRAGMKEGNRSGLWYECRRAIDELRPLFVLIENVLGLFTATTDRYVESCSFCMGELEPGAEYALRALPVVLADLSEVGYDARWHTLRASDIGAPHRRERVFIWAYAADARSQGLERSRGQAGQIAA